MFERLSGFYCRFLGLARKAEAVKGWSTVDPATLRKVVGILGMGLPWIMWGWGSILLGEELQSSISAYYYLRAGDGFVGILFVVGWFLFAYRGYSRVDDRAGDLACVTALGIALFPHAGHPIERIVHFGSAAIMFLTLSFFSICLFTKSDGEVKGRKKTRNAWYRALGWVIIASVACVPISALILSTDQREDIKVVFVLETIALTAFGLAWFIKGEGMLRDLPEAAEPSASG